MKKYLSLMLETFKKSFKYKGRSSNLEFVLFSVSSLIYMFFIMPLIALIIYMGLLKTVASNATEEQMRNSFISFFGPILDFLISFIPVQYADILMGLIFLLFALLVLILLFGPIFFASISLVVRRLHDLGHSGKWILAFILGSLIPILGVLFSFALIIYLSFKKGKNESNKYGEPPVL